MPWVVVVGVAVDPKLVYVVELLLMLSKVTLDLLTQYLCIERRGHGVLYKACLFPPSLTGHTQHNVLHLHLKNNLRRLNQTNENHESSQNTSAFVMLL